MKTKDAYIFWSEDKPAPLIVEGIEESRKVSSDEYEYSGGAAYSAWQEKAKKHEHYAHFMCLALYNELVAYYMLDPILTHEAFIQIEEYERNFNVSHIV